MRESPAAAASAVLYDGRSAEMLVAFADGATGALHTLQFEDAVAGVDKAPLLLHADWDRVAPPGASLVLPEGGQQMARLSEYWIMWRDGDRLFGQSAQQSEPLSSPLVEEEWIIDRPVMAGRDQLHVYSWRAGRLIRHRFGPQVTIEAVMDMPAMPARSACAPLPGDADGTVFLGFVESSEEGIAATAMYVRAGKVMQLRGEPEGRYRLMGRHRMGVHVGRKTRPALAMMTVDAAGFYALLEARFDFAKKECVWKRTKLETVPPGSLASAAVFYYKTQDSPEPFLLAVDAAGHLVSPRRRTVHTLRTDVGAGYGYPVLTTTANRYEATGAGMEIALARL